ncbi:MAG: cold shock domain-containing protein [Alphaproteobacteria bacterium]|nr:MAG: cold shock domain-containing protein [Alphaproteobacteria bacterium]
MHFLKHNIQNLQKNLANDNPLPSCDDSALLEVTCIVKWFKHKCGYGFLFSETVNEDIFIHISTIQECGIRSNLLYGDILECTVKQHGHMQKPEVVKIHSCTRKDINLRELTSVIGSVKWFNIACDYGFISDGSSDIFVSGTLLRKSSIAISDFEENTEVSCAFLETNHKKIAYDIKILKNAANKNQHSR